MVCFTPHDPYARGRLQERPSRVGAGPEEARARAANLLRDIAEQSTELIAALDTDYRLITFNRAFRADFVELFGVEPELGMDFRDILGHRPVERGNLVEAWDRALSGEEFAMVTAVGDPGRARRVYELSFRSLRDPAGRLVGASHLARDVTARVEAGAEVERLHTELEDRILDRTAQLEQRRAAAALEQARLRAVLDILPVGVWIADAQGRLVQTNQAGRSIWGEGVRMSETPSEYGHDFRAWWPDGRRITSEEWGLARALKRGEVSIAEEIRIETVDGRRKTILNYALPIRDEEERIVGGVVVNVDITGRKAEERRQELLAAAGAVLSSPLELESRLTRLVGLVVERLADIAIIDLLDADGNPRRVEVGFADPSMEEAARRLRSYPQDVAFWPGTLRAVRRGEPVVVAEVPEDDPTSAIPEPRHAAFAAGLGVRSILVVPLKAEGQVTGALTLLSLDRVRRYGPVEVETATELADRVALALENVRLFQEARKAVREREDVVALVSHDLRNPLHTIQMATRLLEEEGLGEAERETQRAVILRATARMERLIEDLLAVTRMGAGTYRIEPAPVDPGALVDEAVEMAAAEARPRGVAVEREVPRGLPPVDADRHRILQVFSNLLSNAVRFTPEGGRVRIRARREGASVRFAVVDSGPGVDPEERDSIFDRFWQGARSADGGAGLGLSIARGIVEAHGGTIRLLEDHERDGDGSGATFVFDLPTADGADPPV